MTARVDITSWYFWLGTFTGQALLLVVALPFSLLAVCALAHRRRSRGATAAWARRTSLTDVGMVHGTVPWVWMTMLPGSHAGAVPGRASMVPLEDLPTMGWPGIVGNLLVFAAAGFFAPMRVAALASLPRILTLAASCSVLIEVAQYVLRLDRVSSVDDVLLNAAGAGLAALASRRWWLARPSGSGADPDPHDRAVLDLGARVGVLPVDETAAAGGVRRVLRDGQHPGVQGTVVGVDGRHADQFGDPHGADGRGGEDGADVAHRGCSS